MSSTNLNTINQPVNHRNWGYYLLLILFVFWFIFLIFFKHANEAILPISLVQNKITKQQHEIITPVFLKVKLGSRVLKGDTLGVKVDSNTWNKIKLVENVLSDYTNKTLFLSKLKGIKTGIDTIDARLQDLINSLSIKSSRKEKVLKPQLKKVESYVEHDNTKEIQKAEEKLKLLQSKYAQKKVEYNELLKASKDLAILRENKTTKIKVVQYVPVKQTENRKPSLIQTEVISDNTIRLIVALNKYLNQWESENVIIADKEGILECIGGSSQKGNCFTVTKCNKQIFAFSNPGIIAQDSISVSLINKDGKVLQRLNAIKDSLVDRFIIQDQSGVLESYVHENKNVQILYKEPGQSYYSWLINRLNYK